MKTKINFFLKQKNFSVSARKCGFLGRIFGLMFKKKENAEVLLFSYDSPRKNGIHSFFVFFSFVAVWLDKNGNVVDVKKIKPFRPVIFPPEKFTDVLEIPINDKYVRITDEILRSDGPEK